MMHLVGGVSTKRMKPLRAITLCTIAIKDATGVTPNKAKVTCKRCLLTMIRAELKGPMFPKTVNEALMDYILSSVFRDSLFPKMMQVVPK